jgi:hypothetical protein
MTTAGGDEVYECLYRQDRWGEKNQDLLKASQDDKSRSCTPPSPSVRV